MKINTKTGLKLAALAALIFWGLPAHAGKFSNLEVYPSSASYHVGYADSAGSLRPGANTDRVLTSSGAAVILSTSATAGYSPFRVLNNVGAEILKMAQNGALTVSSFIGNLTGNVTGNVTGDVTGNVTGNLTGNVTGNVTGAASLNVLKAGDTMTGTLIGTHVAVSSVVASYSVGIGSAVPTQALVVIGSQTTTGDIMTRGNTAWGRITSAPLGTPAGSVKMSWNGHSQATRDNAANVGGFYRIADGSAHAWGSDRYTQMQFIPGSDEDGHLSIGNAPGYTDPLQDYSINAREGYRAGYNASGNTRDTSTDLFSAEDTTRASMLLGSLGTYGRAWRISSLASGKLSINDGGSYGAVDGVGEVVSFSSSGAVYQSITVTTMTVTDRITTAALTATGGISAATVAASTITASVAIGVSTTAPVWPLTVVNSAMTGLNADFVSGTQVNLGALWSQAAGGGGQFLVMSSTDSTNQSAGINSQIIVRAIGNAGTPSLLIQSSSGTYTNKSIFGTASKGIGNLIFQGWTSGTTWSNLARISAFTEGVPASASNIPTFLDFYTASTGTVSATAKMRLTSSGQLKVSAAVSTVAVLSGWSPEANAFSTLHGSLQLGVDPLYAGVLDYNASGNSTFNINNTYDSASAVIRLRHRTDVPANAVTSLSATSGSSTFYGSTMTVASSGIVSAPSQSGARVCEASIDRTYVNPTGGANDIMFFGSTANGGFNYQNTINLTTSSGTFTTRGAGRYRHGCCLAITTTAVTDFRIYMQGSGISAAKYFNPGTGTNIGYCVEATSYIADGVTLSCSMYSNGTITVAGSAGCGVNQGWLEKVW